MTEKPDLNVRHRLLDHLGIAGKATIDAVALDDGSWSLRVRLFSADDEPSESLTSFEGYSVCWQIIPPPKIGF